MPPAPCLFAALRAMLRVCGLALGAVLLVAGAPSPKPLPAPQGEGPYNLRAWALGDGAPADIWALAQAPDGYLLLGTGGGLYRFDGLQFERVVPQVGRFPSNNITALLVAPDGTVWLGTYSGRVTRLRAGRADSFGTADATVQQLARRADGSLWIARSGPGGGLFLLDRAGWRRLGAASGIAGGQAFSVIVTRAGAVWVATESRILVLRPGTTRFVERARVEGTVRLAEAPDGRVWASGGRLVGPGADLAIAPRIPGATGPAADRMIVSRAGDLWQSLFGGGVARMLGLARGGSPRALERLGEEQGLPSPVAVPIFEDREANVWIGTNLGLVRLRPVSGGTVLRLNSKRHGGVDLAATAGGGAYVSQGETVYRIGAGGLRPERVMAGPVTFLAADGGDLIVGEASRLYRLRGRGWQQLDLPAFPGESTGWRRDRRGDVWIGVFNRGVFRQAGGRWRQVRPAGIDAAALHLSLEGSGDSWLYAGDRLFRATADRIVPVPPPGDQGGVGEIALVSSGPAGTLIGGELGLARLRGDRWEALDSTANPEIVGVTGILQRANGEVWINGAHGLARTTQADLDGALGHPGAVLRARLFGAADGLPGVAKQVTFKNTLVEGLDVRIWAAASNGLGWIDPARLVDNHLPPPVVIRAVIVGDRRFDDPVQLALPAGTESLRIRYAAPSLAAAEQVRFRYRLIGSDARWIDAGTVREAYYANLGPGRWRFQVIAANNDGVWNREGATVVIDIAPHYYQTWWFGALLLLALAGLLWLLYSWRLREHLARGRARAEAQIAERERIARELHDTLLQSVQGLMLRFQAAAYATDPGSHANALIESALDRGDDVLIEARDRVRALRSITGAGDPYPHLEAVAQRFTEQGLAVTARREGPLLRLEPADIEQLLAIVHEALANAQRHARTPDADLLLQVERRRWTVEIVDRGEGLPADILASGERLGHYGLVGMRERAAVLGGTLHLCSAAGEGTTVRLVVPR